jgi:hypothetical protein
MRQARPGRMAASPGCAETCARRNRSATLEPMAHRPAEPLTADVDRILAAPFVGVLMAVASPALANRRPA